MGLFDLLCCNDSDVAEKNGFVKTVVHKGVIEEQYKSFSALRPRPGGMMYMHYNFLIKEGVLATLTQNNNEATVSFALEAGARILLEGDTLNVMVSSVSDRFQIYHIDDEIIILRANNISSTEYLKGTKFIADEHGVDIYVGGHSSTLNFAVNPGSSDVLVTELGVTHEHHTFTY